MWDYGFQAAQRKKKKVRARYNAVNDQVLQETMRITLPDDTLVALDTTVCKTVTSFTKVLVATQSSRGGSDETLWMTALDASFSLNQALSNEDEESQYEVGNISINKQFLESGWHRDELNDTLPMDADIDDTPLNAAFVISYLLRKFAKCCIRILLLSVLISKKVK